MFGIDIMGVDVHISLVDWSKFIAATQEGKFPELCNQAYFEDEPEWCLCYLPNDFINNFSVAMEASELYDAMRPHIDGGLRETCDRFFSVFFWNVVQSRFNDLGLKGSDLELYPVSIAPNRKADLLHLGKQISVEDLETAYNLSSANITWHYLSDFDWLKRYVLQWIKLLEHSVKSDCGILISIA